MKTYMPKKEDVKRKWFIIDANNQILGRIASQIAHILKGKHKSEYAPHVDLGDNVIIINAEKVKVTGKKSFDISYKRYSGYPGGLKNITYSHMKEKKPEFIIKHAVKGMLPKNILGRKMIKKLHIYTGPDHPHQAQRPENLPNNLRRI
ncbi:MAG: 50S ribosomal protein L13 [bacterium]